MSVLTRVLIAGTGPAAVQLAVLLKRWHGSSVAIVGRQSVRSAPFFEALEHNGNLLSAEAGKPTLTALAGECRLDGCFAGYATARGSWDTLLLAVTADAYLPVLAELQPELLASLRCVALLSPTFGSHALVRQYLREQGSNAETISLSTYLGDTRRASDDEPTRVLTAAVKRRVYIGSAGEGERRGTEAGASGMSEGGPGASESESGTSEGESGTSD
ncbi:opine metallophore biosynthesis dehydrogenase, partial [Paenibacillus sp. 598K]|uniref:opine metallophore biosynthesis dehydrogenase n=1 Tax=Paenibacillus sp. 598K TaxID=1117987 RepID=UPI000FFECC35